MASVAVPSTPMPTAAMAGRALPPLISPSGCHSTGTAAICAAPAAAGITLPRLRIAAEGKLACTDSPHQWPSASHKLEGSSDRDRHAVIREERREILASSSTCSSSNGASQYPGSATASSPVGVQGRSPSSPTAFSEKIEHKFGLAHLLEAAQHCHSMVTSTLHIPSRKRPLSHEEAPNQAPNQAALNMKNHLHSIDYLINGRQDDSERPTKRARPDLYLDVTPSNHESLLPRFSGYSSYYSHDLTQPATTPVFQQHVVQFPRMTPTGCRSEVRSPTIASLLSSPQSDSSVEPKTVWETVMATGNFPDDVCLSESSSCCSKPTENSSHPVKQGRWTNDEKEFAENLIQQVRNGEAVLPPNVSLRKFIADSLQCKAMRVSKKFRSLKSCQSPQGSDERKFNPLSLHSIMNDDSLETSIREMDNLSSPKAPKTLKRSDYSQHGAVRSGRWSIEEENYAKAMIDAFKAGFLPLHGNVSLRKFLSEVLVCHPMRISKKFVGYVRKYHWYRIAAGKCDPEAKRQALERLCSLEREFWASLQQNQEWAAIQQENRS